MASMIKSLLIANRGEIACRVIKTARAMGIRTIAVYSDADANARHTLMADEAIHIGKAPPRESYLNGAAVLDAARLSGAEAIHPGYGFLSENADFAEAAAKAGIIFVGPPPAAIRAMGLKDRAKALMRDAQVPVVPGEFGADQSHPFLARRAQEIGFPIMIKAVAGGGGKGMRKVDRMEDFDAALDGAKREAIGAFGDDRMMLERFVTSPRHIEVQVFGDTHGNVVHLFERDCSLQRRHQKVIEEAPAPGMTDAFRARICEAAVQAARAIGYVGAGTVEFIADGANGLDPDRAYFLEMNTRLQVEHPVTEAILGLDLVEWQLRVASGEALPLRQDQIHLTGHAMEARLYAEDPARGFLPSIGTLAHLSLPDHLPGMRVDSGIDHGGTVSVHYDPMIAKIIAFGPSRLDAARKLAFALDHVAALGVETNARFLARLARHPEFLDGTIDTGFIERHQDHLIPATPTAAEPQALCAAITMLVAQRQKAALNHDPASPFAVLDGFRVNGISEERIDLIWRDQPIEVLLRRQGGDLSLTIGDAVYLIRPGEIQGDSIGFRVNGRHLSAIVAIKDKRIDLLMGGVSWRFDLRDYAQTQEDGAGAGAMVLAPMPGKVIAISVKIGDAVKAGAPLVVLEAMKMEHTLRATGDGIVARLNVALGDQVTDGALIVALEAPTDAAIDTAAKGAPRP